jgi:glycerol-3-phosphate acyltransferase PlsX
LKIIVDAMGGDNAPLEVVKGAIAAVNELKAEILLVGNGEEILRCIQKLGMTNIPKGIEISNTTEVVTMEDDPSKAVREKKDSSMTVMLNMLRDGAGEAAVSAGSTGALLSGSTLVVKRIRGIRRAALAPIIPNGKGGSVLIDCGANAECTSEYLMQFAYMGTAYAKYMFNKERPTLGLLNIGSEEHKGTELQRETYKALKEAAEQDKLNFIGNIESREIFEGKADVIVADGYSGNILLKAIEGTALYLTAELKTMFYKNFKTKLAALLMKRDFKDFKKKLDYGEVGGSIFLGIAKPVIKAHGSSDAKAIKSAIGQAMKIASTDMIKEISSRMDDMKLPPLEI